MAYKILVAEDDADICEVLRLYLENAGFTVMLAENGSRAYDLVMSERPDLAIFDIMMPEMNGFELTKRVRVTSSTPLTGHFPGVRFLP